MPSSTRYAAPLDLPLEGPRAEARLRRLQRRFRQAALPQSRLSAPALAALCATVFLTVLALGLAAPALLG